MGKTGLVEYWRALQRVLGNCSQVAFGTVDSWIHFQVTAGL